MNILKKFFNSIKSNLLVTYIIIGTIAMFLAFIHVILSYDNIIELLFHISKQNINMIFRI
ncbi:hypothetical protein HMPREF0179_05068 [Bilophila wadsworthia 3_1_6]|uniref:Uncharacterized protein n=1 Tax=Bilophila wadsworthia (strain 3_1_6) TaxID=563192 RepID=S2KTD3_BILW3|nr:hypothetical protein HMPREF0179_05068 [Bilophila wadsworthia 3_1_6]